MKFLCIFFETFAEFIKENYSILLIVLGIVGYWLSKKSYDNNNAPVLFPISFDHNNCTIEVVNKGKGIAKNIKITSYNHFMTVPDSSDFKIWKLTFKPLGFLSQGETKEIEAKQKNSSLFCNCFQNKDKSSPLFVTYQNLDGKHYLTKAKIHDEKILSVKFKANSLLSRKLNELIEFINYNRINLFCKIKSFFPIK